MTEATCARCGAAEMVPELSGGDRLYGTTAERFGIGRCLGCGMRRLDPRPDPREMARYYPEAYWFDAGGLAQAYRRLVIRDHIGFVIRACADLCNVVRMLDVGCGGGLLAGMLRERGIAAIGLDWSVSACRLAAGRYQVPCVAGDLGTGSPFRKGAFHIVTMFHVLEHLADPVAALESAYEALDAEGQLIVQVPNFDSWQSGLLRERWNGLDIPRHLQLFRPEDLEAVLGRAGFRVVRWKHFSWRDNSAGLATSLAPGLDPMARRVRGRPGGLVQSCAYLCLTVGSLPGAALEAAFGHGATVMVQARKQ